MDFLNKHAHVQVAVVDTDLEQSVIDEVAEGYSTGRDYGWDLTQDAALVKF